MPVVKYKSVYAMIWFHLILKPLGEKVISPAKFQSNQPDKSPKKFVELTLTSGSLYIITYMVWK